MILLIFKRTPQNKQTLRAGRQPAPVRHHFVDGKGYTKWLDAWMNVMAQLDDDPDLREEWERRHGEREDEEEVESAARPKRQIQ